MKIIFVFLFAFCFVFYFFIKKIPDYSRKSGYRYVFISDYEKNKSGYCVLTETKLSDEDLIRRGVFDYLWKEKVISELMSGIESRLLDREPLNNERNIGYYYSDSIELPRLIDELNNIDFKNNPDNQVDDLLNRFKFQNVIYFENFVFDKKKSTAGFATPVLFYHGHGKYSIIPSQSFLIDNDPKGFRFNYIYFGGKSKISNFEQLKYYKNIESHLMGNKYLIDNCGFSNIDIERSLNEIKEALLNGG